MGEALDPEASQGEFRGFLKDLHIEAACGRLELSALAPRASMRGAGFTHFRPSVRGVTIMIGELTLGTLALGTLGPP